MGYSSTCAADINELLQCETRRTEAAELLAEALAVAVIGLHAALVAVVGAGSAPASLTAALAEAVATNTRGASPLSAFVLISVCVLEAARLGRVLCDPLRQPVRNQRFARGRCRAQRLRGGWGVSLADERGGRGGRPGGAPTRRAAWGLPFLGAHGGGARKSFCVLLEHASVSRSNPVHAHTQNNE